MTLSLKPYPEYKESGLPWLGKIPVHWEVFRNGRLFEQRNQTGFSDLPILEVSLRTGVRVRDFENSSRKQVMADREKYKRARQGDIAYNMMRMWQGAVGIAPVDGLISPAYVVARPFSGTESSFFSYLFRTKAYMDEVDKYSHGIVKDRNRLYWEDFKQMPSLVPPTEEQKRIAGFLDAYCRIVARLIRAKRRLIELLNEQKRVIIHKAVTRGLDPNARMKPSGIEWLGDVPEHWCIVPLKRAARLHRGYDLPEYARQPGTFPVVSSGGTIGTHNAAMAKGPGVVTGRYGSTGAIYYIDQDFWPHNTSLYVCDFSGNLPRFVFYLLHILAFEAHSGKSAVPGIDRKDLHDVKVACPQLEEQTRIAQFLDHELVGLEQVINGVLHNIDVLGEYRRRLIADVVTGKLDVRGVELPAMQDTDTSDYVDIEHEIETDELPDPAEPTDD